jgi:hypothetical protein
MAGSNYQAGRGKMAQARLWASVAFIEGEVKEVNVCAVVSGRGWVLESGNFCEGRGCHFG